MTDTPDDIRAIQLRIWLSKPPAERLKQFMLDNDMLMQFWRTAKGNIKETEFLIKPSFKKDDQL